ncbi:MAG: peptidylprolyl isomerase [Candidatus Stygibacter australis]|nr:peptidylprolyl isomerase [Candidatus Stygibacter australis]
MFEMMRRNAKPIFWVVAIIFIVGMAFMSGTGVFTSKTPFLAKIEGQKITYTDYKQMLQRAYGKYAEENPDTEIDDAVMDKINNDTFKQLKDEIIMNKAIKKYRIKVTDDDVIEKLNNPGDNVKQISGLQTDGKFDMDKYNDALMNDDQFGQYLEALYRNSIPYEKLYSRIKSEVVITMDDVKEDYINKNDKADAKIIFFDAKKIKSVEVTDDEITAYYEENKEDYKKDPARKYKYVKLSLEASDADKNRAKTRIDSIYAKVTTENFADMAIEYSEGPSGPNGGDLNWFGRGKMVKEFDEMVFKMAVGDISKPILTQFGWHIIHKRDIRKTEDGQDEVLASHILINVEPSQQTKDNLSVIAMDIYDLAEEVGLDSAASQMKYEAKETREFYADATYISGIGREESLVKFAFDKKVGTVAEPIKQTDDSYMIAEISYEVGEHYQDLEEVKSKIKRTLETSRKAEVVSAKADSFMTAYQPEEYLAKAEEEGWEIVDATEVTIDKSIPKIRKVDELNKAILDLVIDQHTDLIKDDNGAYIAFITSRTKPDMEKFETDKDSLLETLQETKETEHLNEWYQDMIQNAEVIDNRSVYDL